jgi:RND family efflux transporter MFP subunit
LSGVIRYELETPLSFTTPGKIAAITVREGDLVQRGQMLAALDLQSVQGDLAVATAEQARAAAEARRATDLLAKGWITRSSVERADAALAVASARVRQARFAVETARLKAPSGGRVLARPARPGQVVAPGEPVLVIGEADSGLVFRASAGAADLAVVRPGLPVRVTIARAQPLALSGVVRSVDGRADPATGAFSVQIALPAGAAVLSGEIGTAEIAGGTGDVGAVEIAAQAVVGIRDDEAVVFVYDLRRRSVAARSVQVEAMADSGFRVRGVQPGELVVVRGAERVRNGAAVRLAPLKTATSLD